MSCPVSAAWSRPVLSLCYTESGPSHGAVLSGRITTIAMFRSDQLGRRCIVGCTVAAYTSADASVTHERALEIREPSYMPRAAKPFFIHVDHSPPGAVGHMVAPELPSQEGKARSRETHGGIGAHLSKEARSEAVGHVTASELTSTRRPGSELRDMWWRRSSPQQGSELRSRRTCGGSGAHLYREVWFEATAYVAACGCMPCSLS
jgi:hypothetical protein